MSGRSEEAGDVSEVPRRLYPLLYGFAVALTGQPAMACDLAHRTLAMLEDGGPERRGQASLVLFAYRQLHGLWLEHVRRRQGSDDEAYADARCFSLPAISPEGAVANKGLARIIAGLPPQQRATLLLVYGEGLSYDEAAEIFGVSLKDVMTRLVRGHVAVGHWLDQRCVADKAGAGDAEDPAERVA